MGNIISGQVEQVFKKQMDFQAENMKMQMERQIEMQNQMRIRMQAASVARARDAFTFIGTFFGLVSFGLTGAALKKRSAAPITPLIPLSVIVAYWYDLAWGDKVPRVTAWAEEIMEHEQHLLKVPHGMPTFKDIDSEVKLRRNASKE